MRVGAALLVVVFALLACKSQTKKQAYAEAKPAADALRAKVVQAASLVEAEAPPASDSVCKSTKKLTFAPESDAHDTDYIMLKEAKRGAAKPDDSDEEDVDLVFNTPMTQLLRGTNGFYADYMLTDPARQDLLDTLRRGKNVKNVVIVRSRGTDLDYFLVDLGASSIVCKGTFEANADPNLGTRTENYDLVTKDKRTGKELARERKSDTHDDRKSALFNDAMGKLRARMKAELQLDAPQ